MSPLRSAPAFCSLLAWACLSGLPHTGQGLESKKSASAEAQVIKSLEGHLVIAQGDAPIPYAFPNAEKLEYIAFYRTASWCGPCRAFFPELKHKYEQLKKKHDNFEFVSLTADDNARDWLSFLLEKKAPWPSLDFRSSNLARQLKRGNRSRYIPSIHIVRTDGTLLDDGTAGPQLSLARLKELLEQSSTASKTAPSPNK